MFGFFGMVLLQFINFMSHFKIFLFFKIILPDYYRFLILLSIVFSLNKIMRSVQKKILVINASIS